MVTKHGRIMFVCVCVCVCVCVFTSIHHEGFIRLEQLERQGTDQRCVGDVIISANSLYRYFRLNIF